MQKEAVLDEVAEGGYLRPPKMEEWKEVRKDGGR